MYIIQKTLLTTWILFVSANAQLKAHSKREQIPVYSLKSSRLPPYAIQVDPLTSYSQRDPFYNPVANLRSDGQSYRDDPIPYDHYNEPEPIIEIIIKESNETLQAPQNPPPVLQPRPKKEPIQVFYVKYEKKQGYDDSKPRIVYDPPVPALNPIEEHEEIKPNGPDDHSDYEPEITSTEASVPDVSTTLRAIIRPESEVYNSGSSGIRVTFGSVQIPTNTYNERSDTVAPVANSTVRQKNSALPPPAPGSPKRQHGPYHNIQQTPYTGGPPILPQQRFTDAFSPHQHLPPFLQASQQQSKFHPNPPDNLHSSNPQRNPITFQGLPEIHQRSPFQPFGHSNKFNTNYPQQPSLPTLQRNPHQSAYSQSQPALLAPNRNFESNVQQKPYQPHQQFHQLRPQQPPQLPQVQHQKQQQQQQPHNVDTSRYYQNYQFQQQHRNSEQKGIHQQQRQQELQVQQNPREIIQDERRIPNRPTQIYQQNYQNPQFQFTNSPRNQDQPLNHQLRTTPQVQNPGGEILKAVPKLEQHYAITENPLYPGPFPPNPHTKIVQHQETGQREYSQQHFSPNAEGQKKEGQYFVRNSVSIVGNSSQYQQRNIASHQANQGNYQSYPEIPVQRDIYRTLPLQKHTWGAPTQRDNKPSRDTTSSYFNNFGATSTGSANYVSISSTTPVPTTTTTTTTTTTPRPTTEATTLAPHNKAKIRENIANLPDEVPDDIREQLLSSGILGNADIQILDYDKVGGIPIEDLPPEALSNFYSGGGPSAAAASEPIPAISKYTPESVRKFGKKEHPKRMAINKVEQSIIRPGGIEMKVVHFDPNTAQGQKIANQHIRSDAVQLKPVTIGSTADAPNNRYLPLKVSGTSFPIPDTPELRGKKISSLVVLAPIDYSEFQEDKHNSKSSSQYSRMLTEGKQIKFLYNHWLQKLITHPTTDNYAKWLEMESRTEPQKQSIILLFATKKNDSEGKEDIFIYDVSTQSVSKLEGNLSNTIVDAAESNLLKSHKTQ